MNSKNINKENAPNGFLAWWEVFVGNILILSFVILAYISSATTVKVFAITLSTLLEIFLIVFRKRPISANFKVGINSGIDLRWNLKKGEQIIN